jgi:alginate O-acetyltransferase complex protein AlgI
MLFQTWSFLIFFAVAYPVYLVLRRTRLRLLYLTGVSYFFYGWLNPLYPVLLLYTTAVDYFAVRFLVKSTKKKRWIVLSIVNNMALLGFFKYGLFVIDNINALFSSLNLAYEIPAPGILLPIGISFYTFRSLTYTIDCYRGTLDREGSFIHHAAFVSFFPLLLAGPIERAKTLLPQLRDNAPITGEDIGDGLSLFVVGLFKKLALADFLALYVNKIYSAPGEYQSAALIAATVAFSWQIYFDFSGYSDMARGVARMFGFKIMLNFDNPYLATGLGDFWRRWHISLSTWFRDYVYISLGGNRKGAFLTSFNIFLTMLVSGLWHGAAWTFVIWGAVHGLFAGFLRGLEASATYKQKVPLWVKRTIVFTLVSFAWIFFKAANLADAMLIIKRMFTSGVDDPALPLTLAAMVLLVWLYQAAYESRFKLVLNKPVLRIGIVVSMILYMCIFAGSGGQAFIYFQF